MKRFKFKSKEYIEENKSELSWSDKMYYLLKDNKIYEINSYPGKVLLINDPGLSSGIRSYSSRYCVVILKAHLASGDKGSHYWFIEPDAIEWLEEELTKEELSNPKLKQFIKELEEIDNI